MSVSAATRATGLFFEHRDSTTGVVLDNLRVTQEGAFPPSVCRPIRWPSVCSVRWGTILNGVFGDVAATGKGATWGVSLTPGDRATLHVDRSRPFREDAGSETYGVQFTGKDDVAVTLGEVVSRAEGQRGP